MGVSGAGGSPFPGLASPITTALWSSTQGENGAQGDKLTDRGFSATCRSALPHQGLLTQRAHLAERVPPSTLRGKGQLELRNQIHRQSCFHGLDSRPGPSPSQRSQGTRARPRDTPALAGQGGALRRTSAQQTSPMEAGPWFRRG